jgi:hypothetical protein
MNIQQPADLAMEIHFASLDTWTEQRALTDLQHSSSQTEAIGMREASNTDAVADFHLCHGSLPRIKFRQATENYPLIAVGMQRFSVQICCANDKFVGLEQGNYFPS